MSAIDYKVEGSLAYQDESDASSDDSESERESDREFVTSTAFQSTVIANRYDDDDEEEIEVFGGSGTVISNRANVSIANNKTDIPVSVDDLFLEETLTDGQNMSNTYSSPAQKQLQPQENKPQQVIYDDNDEFSFDETANTTSASQALQNALAVASKVAHEEAATVIEFNEQEHHEVIEPMLNTMNDLFANMQDVQAPIIIDKTYINHSATNKEVLAMDSKKALQEIVDIYSNGMGDLEVLLLDLPEKESESEKLENIRQAEQLQRGKLMIIKEGDDEEEDEEEDDSSNQDKKQKYVNQGDEFYSVSVNQSTITTTTTTPVAVNAADKAIEDEWDSIVVELAPSTTTTSASTTTNPSIKYDYPATLSYIQTLNLQEFESLIVVSESSTQNEKTSTFSLTRRNNELNFPGCQEQLKFPFLVAQLDYNPYDMIHLSMLSYIFQKLIKLNRADKALVPIDDRWEMLGFQGKDPRTDLNRSIKMFSILQLWYLIDTKPVLAQQLFDLSQSADPSASRRSSAMDKSWPFFCVSISFSKESIQALRRGDLNSFCNAKKTVLEVVHDFYQGCFFKFGKLIVKEPNKHHATQLSVVRELCTSNASKLMKTYAPCTSLPAKYLTSATKQNNADRPSILETFNEIDDVDKETEVSSGAQVTSGRASKFLMK